MILLFALVKPDVYVFLGPHRYALRKIFICEVAGFADCVCKTRNLTYRRVTVMVGADYRAGLAFNSMRRKMR